MEPVSVQATKREWLITGICQHNGIGSLQFFVKLSSILQALTHTIKYQIQILTQTQAEFYNTIDCKFSYSIPTLNQLG